MRRPFAPIDECSERLIHKLAIGRDNRDREAIIGRSRSIEVNERHTRSICRPNGGDDCLIVRMYHDDSVDAPLQHGLQLLYLRFASMFDTASNTDPPRAWISRQAKTRN